MVSRPVALMVGAAHAFTSLLLAWGVFVALPARWWPVDVPAGTLALLEGVAAMGLWARSMWGPAFARVTAAIALAVGLLLVTVLAMTASWLSGIYGPVGWGGAVILALVAALVLPYLVALPAAQLILLRRATRGIAPESA